MEFTSEYISYNEIDKFISNIRGDKYGLASKYSKFRRNAFFANPFLKDYSTCTLSIKRADGDIVGRTMPFLTSIKMDGEIIECNSGSTLDVVENFRKYALGVDFMTESAPGFNSKFNLSAGISKLALPLYKKLNYSVFAFPRLLFVKNVRPILNKRGMGWLSFGINPFLNIYFSLISKHRLDKFIIEKVSCVPDWVGDLALNDGHRFMENHSREWFQWNLDYNFSGHKLDNQSLYLVMSHNNEKLGFFMIKERWRESAGPLNNIILGSIVEWGTYDKEVLSESDIIKLALGKFSKNVDFIEFASDNPQTVKTMKRFGFLKFDYAHIAFRDKKKKFPEAVNPDNWRLRLGYADVILS